MHVAQSANPFPKLLLQIAPRTKLATSNTKLSTVMHAKNGQVENVHRYVELANIAAQAAVMSEPMIRNSIVNILCSV